MSQILIDGSYGEGGGQIIRSSLTLAAITQQKIKINHIRIKRKIPGLAPQHLMACRAVAEVCDGVLENDVLRSTEISFSPSKIKSGSFEFNIGTAGSVSLVAQSVIPILLFASGPSTVRIIGGTHVPRSPSYDYLEKVYFPAVRHFGGHIISKMIQPGFYPRGQGIIEIEIQPSQLIGQTGWQVDKNSPVQALIRLCHLPEHIGEREQQVLNQYQINDVVVDHLSGISPGNAILIWHGYRGVTSLGERGKPAELVALEAVMDWQRESYDVDRYLADQLILISALASGKTSFYTSAVTEHLKTNASIIRLLTQRNIHFAEKLIQID